ncbi:unnamed protein product [Cylicostephanus goldi]|uniref:Mitochondrial carrier protein n=1 Tax=Cylicostephanus goldi TaxID=71465 RepID=A0A3P7NY69_CYLGO|nr:unnamed protein product [Cylicostephanus goldi]
MMREKGIRGFFIGMSPTLAREMPGYFCFFGAYEASRYMLAKEGQHKDDIGLLKTAASGAIGGMTLWAAVFPFDSIKSRMQLYYFATATSGRSAATPTSRSMDSET